MDHSAGIVTVHNICAMKQLLHEEPTKGTQLSHQVPTLLNFQKHGNRTINRRIRTLYFNRLPAYMYIPMYLSFPYRL